MKTRSYLFACACALFITGLCAMLPSAGGLSKLTDVELELRYQQANDKDVKDDALREKRWRQTLRAWKFWSASIASPGIKG